MSRFRKIVFVIIAISVMVCVFFSRSRFVKKDSLPYRAVSETVIVNTSADDLFNYLGNSANASDWSSFVDHITPFNKDSFADGSYGSRRRCYTSKDGNGATWDEKITIVEPQKQRRLTIYNVVDFSLKSDHLLTDQLYEPLGENKCKLTLSLFLDESAGIMDKMKLHLASKKVETIFANNLQNIKRLCEQQAAN